MRPSDPTRARARALWLCVALTPGALAGCYASHVPETVVTTDGGARDAGGGARDAGGGFDAGPGGRDAGVMGRDAGAIDAGPTLRALFVPECGPADGPALRVFASDTPIACEDLGTLGPHVELYLWFLPDPSMISTLYSWGGTGANASFTRCASATGPCETSTSGSAHADLYVPESRLVIEWTANFSGSTTDMRRVEARFCPHPTFCG